MTMPSSSDRRAAMLGLSVVIGALVMSRGVPLLRQWSEEREHLAMKATRDLALMRRSIEHRGEAQIRLTALRSLRRMHEEWLVSGSPTLDNVAVVRLLSDVAESEGVELTSVLPLADAKSLKGRVARPVRARALFTGDLQAIAYFFAAIEDSKPRLVIRHLALTQPETSLPHSRVEKLRGEMVVEALAWSDTSGSARP